MTWQVKYNPEQDFVESIYSGVVPAEEVRAETIAAERLAKEHRTRRNLVDCRQAEFTLSVVEIMDIPEQYKELGVERPFFYAMVLPESAESSDAVRFFRRHCMAHGWAVEVFPDRQAAIDWLLEY